jgi:hypothetical protein
LKNSFFRSAYLALDDCPYSPGIRKNQKNYGRKRTPAR